ncbi:hypothetical protein JB92DRAFT_1355769 [Gautieria morchelliformis]|nr:hypothetical protein JB92DRAFT_1355769 [Gautieria morchelliformis]
MPGDRAFMLLLLCRLPLRAAPRLALTTSAAPSGIGATGLMVMDIPKPPAEKLLKLPKLALSPGLFGRDADAEPGTEPWLSVSALESSA